MKIYDNHYQAIDFMHKGSEYTFEILREGFARLSKGKEVVGVKNVASRDEALLWAGALVENAPEITCDGKYPNYTIKVNGARVFDSASRPLRDEFFERIQLRVRGEEPPKLISDRLQTLDELVKDKVERILG